MWEIWDKTTPINGKSAERVMERHNHLATEETILIKYVNGRAVQVEGKNILASVYGLDPTLSNEAFIEAYERAIEPTEAVEEEETETEEQHE